MYVTYQTLLLSIVVGMQYFPPARPFITDQFFFFSETNNQRLACMQFAYRLQISSYLQSYYLIPQYRVPKKGETKTMTFKKSFFDDRSTSVTFFLLKRYNTVIVVLLFFLPRFLTTRILDAYLPIYLLLTVARHLPPFSSSLSSYLVTVMISWYSLTLTTHMVCYWRKGGGCGV